MGNYKIKQRLTLTNASQNVCSVMPQSFSALPSHLKHLSPTMKYSNTQNLCSAFAMCCGLPLPIGSCMVNMCKILFSAKYIQRAKVLRAKNSALGL